jgi:hypothetical protein
MEFFATENVSQPCAVGLWQTFPVAIAEWRYRDWLQSRFAVDGSG